MKTLRRLFAPAIVLSALLSTTSASAQHIHTKDPVRVDVHGTLTRWGGIGAGVRAELVVAPEGAIPNFDDDISITAGAELLFFDFDNDHDRDNGFGLWPGLAAQWNFYLGKNWSVFPELGLWLYFGHYHYNRYRGPDRDRWNDDNFGWGLMAGIGGRYHLSSRTALMLRIQFPGLLQFGVTF